MPLSDKNRRVLEQVAESIRELDRQKALQGEQGKRCEWGTGCAQPVLHRCERCWKYLCKSHTEKWRKPKSEPPEIVSYCPGCYSIVSARWSRRQPGE